MIENFDWTQFITFESDDNEQKVMECVNDIFKKMGFRIIPKNEMEHVKLSYYKDFWEVYGLELEDSRFLYKFGEWNNIDEPPLEIVIFVNGIDLLIDRLKIRKLKIIICSLAEKGKTNNLIVDARSNDIYEKLFLMCMNSFVCPDSLIINYTG